VVKRPQKWVYYRKTDPLSSEFNAERLVLWYGKSTWVVYQAMLDFGGPPGPTADQIAVRAHDMGLATVSETVTIRRMPYTMWTTGELVRTHDGKDGRPATFWFPQPTPPPTPPRRRLVRKKPRP
jgi:hypothetical protein